MQTQQGLFIAVICSFLILRTAWTQSPDRTLVVVTAGQGGLLQEVGPLNPHAYRPNEFVVQNMIYEGLVHYGEGGKLVPALAESWDISNVPSSGETAITFNLRKGVKFHDGAPWNAQACVDNLKQVFTPGLKDYHGWYDLPKRVKRWEVVDDMTIRLILDQPYYPALQELTFIRPMRFISPNNLPSKADERSCPTTAPVFWPTNVVDFRCVGVSGVSGTGYWKFVKKVTSKREIGPNVVSITPLQPDEKLLEVHFTRNRDHWDSTAGGNIDTIIIKIMPTFGDIVPAVKAGTVDLVFGLDTIGPNDFRDLHKIDDDNLSTYVSSPTSTRAVLLNSAKPPLNSLAVRRALMHAVDKQNIIQRELGGLELPAYALFSRNVPYTDVDLHPLLSYDPDKVNMILDGAGWTLAPGKKVRTKDGVPLELEFIFRNTSTTEANVEDDIRRDLEKFGFAVKDVPMEHDEWNTRAANGSWHLAFGSTLGLPWDPHATATYFSTWSVHQRQFANLANTTTTSEGLTVSDPMTNVTLGGLVDDVLVETNEGTRKELWARMLRVVHEQAVWLPLSYLVNVAVVNNRFENFRFGGQQYDMPLHNIVDKRALVAADALALGMAAGGGSGNKAGVSGGVIAAITVCSVLAVSAVAFAVVLVSREKKGKPLFAPLLEHGSSTDLEPGYSDVVHHKNVQATISLGLAKM